MANWWASYIRQHARQLGLDPAAVLAVARVEGLSGRPGDQGTSFGPFQLHRGGALPAGRGRAWAESPAGVDYALRRIAGVARGQSGGQAISSIVSRFERPANIPGEIAKAAALYGHGAGAISSSTTVPAPGQQQQLGADPGAARKQIGLALIAASQASSRGERPDYGGVMAAIAAAKQAREAPPPTSAGTITPAVTTGTTKRGGIAELFYDPLGAIKNGRSIPAIGGHGDHVHFASERAQTMLAAISEARRLGLHTGENPYVGRVTPVHVSDSYHYKVIGSYRGRKIGAAVDISGSPARMAAFYRWAARNL